jgi:hypothetical protein
MGSTDVTQAVRRVLVKNWLDMGKIRIQVAGGTVIVRGRLMRARGEDQVNELFIEQLEQQLRGTKGLKQLRFSLDDWEHDRGRWVPKLD